MTTRKIGMKNISSVKVRRAIAALFDATRDFEEVERGDGWIHKCGECSGCYNSKDYYARHRRIAEDFAFAKNSCYTMRLVHFRDKRTTLAYIEHDRWIKDESLTWRELAEYVTLAWKQAREYAKAESDSNKKATSDMSAEVEAGI